MSVSSLELADLLIVLGWIDKVLFELIRNELFPSGPSFLQNLGKDSLAKVLFILYFLIVKDLILGRDMNNPKFSFISDHWHFPLFVSIEVIVKGILFVGFEFLELKDLSECKLGWKNVLAFILSDLNASELMRVCLNMQESILSILRKV